MKKSSLKLSPDDILIMYELDVSVPLEMRFRLIDFDPIISEYFQHNYTYHDPMLHAAIIGCRDFELSLPREDAMGITQHIKGFLGENKEMYMSYVLHFESNEKRDSYAMTLQKLISGMSHAIEVSCGIVCDDNPRILVFI